MVIEHSPSSWCPISVVPRMLNARHRTVERLGPGRFFRVWPNLADFKCANTHAASTLTLSNKMIEVYHACGGKYAQTARHTRKNVPTAFDRLKMQSKLLHRRLHHVAFDRLKMQSKLLYHVVVRCVVLAMSVDDNGKSHSVSTEQTVDVRDCSPSKDHANSVAEASPRLAESRHASRSLAKRSSTHQGRVEPSKRICTSLMLRDPLISASVCRQTIVSAPT